MEGSHKRAWLFSIGSVAGFFSGLFGVGSGMIVVPLLILGLKASPKRAIGTSLAAMVFTISFGVIVYAALERVAWQSAALVGGPAAVGAVVGVHFQSRLASRVLQIGLALLLLTVAAAMMLR